MRSTFSVLILLVATSLMPQLATAHEARVKAPIRQIVCEFRSQFFRTILDVRTGVLSQIYLPDHKHQQSRNITRVHARKVSPTQAQIYSEDGKFLQNLTRVRMADEGSSVESLFFSASWPSYPFGGVASGACYTR